MGTDDASNQVVKIHETLRRRAVAGTTEFSVPTPLRENITVPVAELGLSSEPPTVEVTVSDKIEPALFEDPDTFHTPKVTQVSPAVGDTRRWAQFEQQLSDHPAEIRDAARALAQAVRGQIAELREARRNDTAGLIDFLEMIARELDRLAEALDRAIGSVDQQGIFLGEAKKIADQLKTGLHEYLEQHRADIVGYSIKISLISAAAWFLHACGFDLASIISVLKK
jgi:hypothetical protein